VSQPHIFCFNTHLTPFPRPENILYRSEAPDSDIVIVDFGMYVLSAPLHIDDKLITMYLPTVQSTWSLPMNS
jgi:hypothetical protein